MSLIIISYLIPLLNFGIFFAFNRDKLDLLFKTTTEIITAWCSEQGFIPGICSVMHTFGSDLKFDPHIHILITEGGIDTNSGSWKTCNYFPHQMLKSRFRAVLLKKLRELFKSNRNLLSIPDALKKIWLKKYNFWGNFFALSKKLYDVIWYVHIGTRLHNAYFTVKYIGRYAKRPCLAETRILYYSYEKQIVVFAYHDKHTNTEKTSTIPVEKFISRLIRHIPAKHFKMIRYSGLFANCVKNSYFLILYKQITQLFGIANLQLDPANLSSAQSWRERIIKSTGTDPLTCSKCNEPMELVEIAYRARDGTLKTIIP